MGQTPAVGTLHRHLFICFYFSPDSEEKFFVMPKEKCSDCEQLKVFKEVLLSSEALKPKLDRCLKVSFVA